MNVGLYIPCYNASRTLKECLSAACSQSVRPEEIVVVDDGSTDDSRAIAKQFPVTVLVHQHNLGLAASRNTALQYLRTELVASLDADCVAAPSWLALLLERMQDPAVAGCGGKLEERHAQAACDMWRSVHMCQNWGDAPCTPQFLFGANTLFRRQALMRAGFYAAEYSLNYEDVDMSQRLKEQGCVLAYEPAARVLHLRQDDLYTLLTSFWNWNYPYYRSKGYYRDTQSLERKVKDGIGLANRFWEEDHAAGRHAAYYIDLVLALHHPLKDLQCMLGYAGMPALGCRQMDQLSLWLSLFDIHHFSRPGRRAMPKTIMAATERFSQNLVALLLVAGAGMEKLVPEQEFIERFYQDVVYSLSGLTMPNLSAMLGRMTRDHVAWQKLYAAPHPALDTAFLRQAHASWQEWLDLLISRVPDIKTYLTRWEGR